MKRILKLVLCLLIPFIISPVYSADITGLSMNLMVLDKGNYRLAWSIKDQTISFQVTAKTSGWIAIGFNPTPKIKDTDMIIGYLNPNGQSKIVDAFSTGEKGPYPDDVSLGGTDDILNGKVTYNNGWTLLSFQRKLSTNDKFDKTILLNKPMKVIWSYSSSKNLNSYKDTSNGAVEISFTGKEESKEIVEEKKTEQEKIPETKSIIKISYKTYLISHITFISLTLIIMLLAIGIILFWNKRKGWFKIHRSLLFISFITFIFGFISAILLVNSLGSTHFQGFHKILGASSFLLATFFFILSLFHPWKQNNRNIFRSIHLWSGRILIILFSLNLFLGIVLAKAFFGK